MKRKPESGYRRDVALESEATTFPTWKLKEADHSLRTEGQPIGLLVLSELILCSKRPIPHDVTDAWRRQAESPHHKLVIRP